MVELDESARVDLVFRSLAEPSRRRIVDQLTEGPATVSELASSFDTTLAAVAQHVEVLERARLVTARKVGRSKICELDLEGLGTAGSWITRRRDAWVGRLRRLDEFLTTDEPTPPGAPT